MCVYVWCHYYRNVAAWASKKLMAKLVHKISPHFSTLLHYNYSSVQAIEMTFLPLMNNLLNNIMQLTENKYYNTEPKIFNIFDIVYFVPTWSLFTGPVTTYVTTLDKTCLIYAKYPIHYVVEHVVDSTSLYSYGL